MRVFISGIMQGSRVDGKIDSQGYRHEIARMLRRHVPEVEVLDPFELHPDSVTYGPEQAKQTLLELIALAGQADVLVAYVPSASMGTAIEMWSAYRSSVPVYTICPLADNWVVRSLSERVFPDMAAFAAFVTSGGLSEAEA
jgi:nucleoside 2-deoxyribosyltransferase